MEVGLTLVSSYLAQYPKVFNLCTSLTCAHGPCNSNSGSPCSPIRRSLSCGALTVVPGPRLPYVYFLRCPHLNKDGPMRFSELENLRALGNTKNSDPELPF